MDSVLQMVTFQIGNQHCGVDIMRVQEVYGMEEVRKIPNAPFYIEGIFNLRGRVIPVVNLHQRFHIPRPELSEEDRLLGGFIIISLEQGRLGIIIDRILRVVSYGADAVQPPPEMLSGIGVEYIEGVIHQEEGYLLILNIDRLFEVEELQQIAQIV